MNDPATILNEADMSKPRTPRELCEWVDKKASELSQTKEGKAYARSGARLPKKLWEEIRPLGLFALKRFDTDDVICTPNLSNENYDGTIEFRDRNTNTIYVEITYAKDGYDEHLRLSVLTSDGSVNSLGKLTVSGTKASGRQEIHIENEMVDRAQTRNSVLKLLKERLVSKSTKKYGETHILVVVVDDYLAFRFDEDKVELRKFADTSVSELSLDFGAVYLLGSSGKYCEHLRGKI